VNVVYVFTCPRVASDERGQMILHELEVRTDGLDVALSTNMPDPIINP
jgi:hypothetical protein